MAADKELARLAAEEARALNRTGRYVEGSDYGQLDYLLWGEAASKRANAEAKYTDAAALLVQKITALGGSAVFTPRVGSYTFESITDPGPRVGYTPDSIIDHRPTVPSGGFFFAQGGAFTNGIVVNPTPFNMGLMGEAGPEAIMPLTRTASGDLGVQVQMPAMPNWAEYGRSSDAALVAEIQALRAEVQGLRAEARATAVNTGRSQEMLKRVTRNGEAMQTQAAT